MTPRARSVIGYLLSPYRWLFAGILAATLLTSVLEGVNVAAFFPIFRSMLAGNGSVDAPEGVFALLTRMASRLPFQEPLVAAVVFLVLIMAARILSQMTETALVAYASGTIQHDLKNRLMQRYAGFPCAFFLEKKQGQLLYNATTAASRVGTLCQKIPQLVAHALTAVAVGSVFFLAAPQAAIFLMALGFGYFWMTRLLSGKVSYHIGKARVHSSAEQASVANEFFTGIRQIRSFGTEAAWLKRFWEHSQAFRELYIRDAIWLAVPRIALEVAAILLLAACLLYVRAVSPGSMVSGIPLVAVFGIGLLRFLPSLTQVGQLRMEIVGLLGDAEILYQALRAPVPLSDGKGRPFRTLQGEIELEDVDFVYPGRPPLFQGLRVRFERGETTALVGSSGGGKSTLAYLLLGLLDPIRGRILVDGVDLRELEKRSWRRRIGFVPQDLFLAHASVAENITFGRPGFSEAGVQRAAEVANAASFIRLLPEGYQTLVGERGMKLSGGQQQRIAIARAILEDPEILIFDEATSFLDAESEKLVQEALERISRGRTVLLIAHRLSTVRRADRIVVLEAGRVVEQGSHADLIRGAGRYFQLAAAQSR